MRHLIRFLGSYRVIREFYQQRVRNTVYSCALVDAKQATVIPPLNCLLLTVVRRLSPVLERHDTWLASQFEVIRGRQRIGQYLYGTPPHPKWPCRRRNWPSGSADRA